MKTALLVVGGAALIAFASYELGRRRSDPANGRRDPSQPRQQAQFSLVAPALASTPQDVDPTRSMDPQATIRNALQVLADSGPADEAAPLIQAARTSIGALRMWAEPTRAFLVSDPSCYKAGCTTRIGIAEASSSTPSSVLQAQIGDRIKSSYDGALMVSGIQRGSDGASSLTVVLLNQ